MNEPMTSPLRSGAEDEIDLLSVVTVLAENARLLVFGSLAIGLMVLGISFLIPPTYTASTRILPPQQQQGAAAALLAQQLGSLAGLAGAAAGIKNPADIYIAMLQSRSVADRIVEEFKLVELYEVDYREDARKQLSDLTRVKAGKDSVITVEVDDHDAKRAADMANAYVRRLQELTTTLAVSEAAQRRQFFERQLEQAKNNLTTAEIALRASGVGESILKADPQAAVEGVARLKAEITAAEVRLASMRGYLTNNSVEVRQAENELAALRAQLVKFELADSGAPRERGTEYISKYRDFKYHETLFELMAKQYEMAKLDEAREGALVQVIDAAQPPERKSKPKKALIAVIATTLGFLLISMWVFTREAFRGAQHDVASTQKIERIREALRGSRPRR